MQFGRTILWCIGLTVLLVSGELWLRNGLALNRGRIVFAATRVGNTEIYVMDADGANQERLTNHPSYDFYPSWSPDGTKIAFASGRGAPRRQIYVMNADGQHPIKLTDGPRDKGDTDWSLDGQKIAFTSWEFPHRENPYITVMGADGNNAYKLTDGEEPSWSPDGQRIAFLSGKDRATQISVIGVDGNGLKRVTQGLAYKSAPAWSPDGGRIAYPALQHRILQIYVVDPDGRNRSRLTHSKVHKVAPSWSPDGQTIAYLEVPTRDIVPFNPPTTIHLMTSNGKYLKRLSEDPDGNDYCPDFGWGGLAVSPAYNKSTIWGRLKKLAPNFQ